MKFFCDSHTDFMTKLESFEEKSNYVKSAKLNGAKKICSAIFTTEHNITIKELTKYKQEVDALNQSYNDLLLFAIEDIGSIPTNELEEILPLHPLSATLTWNYQNAYAGGAKCKSGLTKNGVLACKLFESHNIFVDTAHMSEKSFWDFCTITTKPIFNSHTNIFSIHKNKRNLNDSQIKQIVDSNGFMGLTFFQKFISKKAISCKDIAMQFAYLADKFGCNNFGIGSDLFGFDEKYLPTDLKNYRDLTNLELEMKNLGFLEEEIDNLFYKNFLKIFTTIYCSGCTNEACSVKNIYAEWPSFCSDLDLGPGFGNQGLHKN